MTFLCLETSLPMQRSHDTLASRISAENWCLETVLPLPFLCIASLVLLKPRRALRRGYMWTSHNNVFLPLSCFNTSDIQCVHTDRSDSYSTSDSDMGVHGNVLSESDTLFESESGSVKTPLQPPLNCVITCVVRSESSVTIPVISDVFIMD